MTDDEQAMLNSAFGTALGANLILTGIIERLLATNLLQVEEMTFITDEALRQVEQMSGAFPAGQTAFDSAHKLLTSRLALYSSRLKTRPSSGGDPGA